MARVVIDEGGMERLGAHVDSRFSDAVLAKAVLIEAMAPVRTGQLKASVEVEHPSRGEFTVRAGQNLPDGRAVYQELGTSKMAAQPYIRPAWYSGWAI